MSLERIGIAGAGTMGAGIAQAAILGGLETVIQDPDAAALETGITRIRDGLAKGVERGRWSESEAEQALERLTTGGPEIGSLAGCDLVIEAAPEDLELKRRLFAALAEACGPGAVLATNTSSLSVTAIAAPTPGPERVVGMHFFNPPVLMDLVEVVAGDDSSAGALETATEAARRMGKTPIRARDSVGFVGNRCVRPFTLEALRMLGEGLGSHDEIDRVYRLGGGFRMGPFELIDLIGVDVNFAVARSFHEQSFGEPRWRPHPIQARMVAAGRLGRKSGRGFYSYEGERHRDPDPEVDAERPVFDDDELERIAGPLGPLGPRPARRPDRERGLLRPRRAGRLSRGHQHRDAARLQLAAGPARVGRGARLRPGGGHPRGAAGNPRGGLPALAAASPARLRRHQHPRRLVARGATRLVARTLGGSTSVAPPPTWGRRGMRRGKGTLALTAALACALLLAAPAAAQVQPYGANDYGGFRNILPPAQGKSVNGVELALFQSTGTMPSHFDDQRRMYGDLVYATPGLSAGQIPNFFKDSSFGVPPGEVERTYSPRPGVTVLRDSFGVPHIYGTTRANMMFGAGYVGAEDRLFFMDALRHAGRAQLSEFAGGANKAMDAEQWDVAPYTEADLQLQIDLADEVYGAEGILLRDDLSNYVAGINQYISEALIDPSKLPGEYPAAREAPGALEGNRRDRHRLPGRRDLRQGRRRRGQQRRGLQRRSRPIREGERDQGLEGPPAGERPRGADHRPRQDLRLPAGPEAEEEGEEEGERQEGGNGEGEGEAKEEACQPQWGGDPRPRLARARKPRRRRRHPGGRGRELRPRRRAPRRAAWGSRRPRCRLQRAPGLGRRVRLRPPARGLRAPGELLRPPDPDGGGPPRPRLRRPRGRLRRRQPLRPPRSRPGLRLVGDLGRPGHHRLVRRAALRARRRTAHGQLDALPVAGAVPADRGPRAGQQHHSERRRPEPGRDLHAPGPPHRPRDRHPPRHRQRDPGRLRQPPLHLLPRGRFGARASPTSTLPPAPRTLGSSSGR